MTDLIAGNTHNVVFPPLGVLASENSYLRQSVTLAHSANSTGCGELTKTGIN